MLRLRLRIIFGAVASGLLVTGLSLAGGTSVAWAQVTAGVAVRGLLVDPMSAPLAGAGVRAELGSAVVAATTTDSEGRFRLAVSPGRYRLVFNAPGFLEAQEDLVLTAGGVTLPPRVLLLAGVREDITVTASAPGADIRSATKTPTPLLNIPQAITVTNRTAIADQMMVSMGDVLRYVPGVSVHQGENNRDQIVIRGNSSSADFFVDGIRDDVQYFRDVYNLERVETLKGPNAMVFGRGGAGGVVNRVSRTAGVAPLREWSIQTGSFGYKRMTTGVNQPLGDAFAFRVDAVAEDSGSFRQSVGLNRYGITPTLTYSPSGSTRATLRYEFLHDSRTADRGISSFRGRPADVAVATYYGNPMDTFVRANVHLGTAALEHRRNNITFRNQTLFADYGRGYQNYVPGTVTPDKAFVSLSAYNNATDRLNVFNQTDVIAQAHTGAIGHTLLSGVEIGRQATRNIRNTGFFNNDTGSILVPYLHPRTSVPVTFRGTSTDADNAVTTTVAATYIQDQAALTRRIDVVAGLRVDRFSIDFFSHRSGDSLRRPDVLVSPRLGVVVKPASNLALYVSDSVTSLPSAGDQFSSLTNVTAQLEPERFRNYEGGLKWDAPSGLSLTAAAYRLDRTNTRSTDPQDPTRIVQTGSQRTTGFELGLTGTVRKGWSVTGGYTRQLARVTRATVAAPVGREVGQVPHNTLSLWNTLRLHPRVALSAGVLSRSEMFASIDNSVRLPGFARVDAAAFWSLTKALRLQFNMENALNSRYYLNADSNTNISPGAPRGLRVGLTATF